MDSKNAGSRRPINARRRWKAVTRKARELGSIASALLDTGHPYMAHIVPMRRCNLACTYCNEFDDVSDPVPIEEMERRIGEMKVSMSSEVALFILTRLRNSPTRRN